GDYTLNAQSTSVVTTDRSGDGARTMVFTARVMGGGDGQSEFGSIPLSVSGDDMTNVVIATSRGTTVSGRVTYEGGPAPARNTVRISAASVDADNPLSMLGSSSSVTA